MNEYWKRIVDLERENFILKSQLTTKEFKIEIISSPIFKSTHQYLYKLKK